MRACVQRVSRAAVTVDGDVIASIGRGLVVLLAVGRADTRDTAGVMAAKVAQLRIFPDDEGKMNRSVAEAGGRILAVSQFTLYGDVRKGRRPSFIAAADPATGDRLYRQFVDDLAALGLPVATGRFQANMQVELVNDGPVTILIDSERTF